MNIHYALEKGDSDSLEGNLAIYVPFIRSRKSYFKVMLCTDTYAFNHGLETETDQDSVFKYFFGDIISSDEINQRFVGVSLSPDDLFPASLDMSRVFGNSPVDIIRILGVELTHKSDKTLVSKSKTKLTQDLFDYIPLIYFDSYLNQPKGEQVTRRNFKQVIEDFCNPIISSSDNSLREFYKDRIRSLFSQFGIDYESEVFLKLLETSVSDNQRLINLHSSRLHNLVNGDFIRAGVCKRIIELANEDSFGNWDLPINSCLDD
jgi:hypothetical protein